LDTLLLLAVSTSKICQHYGLRQSGLAHKSVFRIRVWKFGYPEENRYYGVYKSIRVLEAENSSASPDGKFIGF
jgi:hypothetical protein